MMGLGKGNSAKHHAANPADRLECGDAVPIRIWKFTERSFLVRVGLDQFMKTLNEKEKRGYTLSDELRLI